MRPLQKSRNSYKYGFYYASNRLETKMLVVYIIDNYLHKMAFATVSTYEKLVSGSTTGWDIEVKVLHWTKSDFLNFSAPTDVWRHPSDLDEDYDQVYPDIAFNFDKGDFYLVFTSERLQDYSEYAYKLRYRHYVRGTGNSWAMGTGESEAYACDPTHGQNCWAPRIDIGWTYALSGGGSLRNFIAIAYTMKWYILDPGPPVVRRELYTVADNYWQAGSTGDQEGNDSYFYNPGYSDNNAGLPEIDIAPNTNYSHSWCLTFTQEVPDPSYWRYETYITSSLDSGILHPVQRSSETDHQDIMPSIVFHYGATQANDNWKEASVSMLHCYAAGAPSDGDTYRAGATVVDLTNGNVQNSGWAMVSYPITNGTAWNPFMVTTINPGVCTDISLFNTGSPPINQYFIGFLNALDGTADSVEVAWGDALYQ